MWWARNARLSAVRSTLREIGTGAVADVRLAAQEHRGLLGRPARGMLQRRAQLAGVQRVDARVGVEHLEQHRRVARSRPARGGRASTTAASPSCSVSDAVPYSLVQVAPSRTARSAPCRAAVPSTRPPRTASGRCVTAAPTSSPPFEPPLMASCSGVVQPSSTSSSAAAWKSSNTFCLLLAACRRGASPRPPRRRRAGWRWRRRRRPPPTPAPPPSSAGSCEIPNPP